MRKPGVPKDWLASSHRWGVQAPPASRAHQWLRVEEMDKYDRASPEERVLWQAYLRASQIQHAICVEVNARMPRLGYRNRSALAWDQMDPHSERRTMLGGSTLSNILSGQRFINLKEVAQLESVLGGGLLTIVSLGAGADESTHTPSPAQPPTRFSSQPPTRFSSQPQSRAVSRPQPVRGESHGRPAEGPPGRR